MAGRGSIGCAFIVGRAIFFTGPRLAVSAPADQDVVDTFDRIRESIGGKVAAYGGRDMTIKPEIHPLAGFHIIPLPGPGGPYVVMITGSRAENVSPSSEPVMHSAGMRLKQARSLAAALLEVADIAAAMDAE